MLAKVIRWVAIVTSLLVVVSFVFFADDQLSRASRADQALVNDRPAPVLPVTTHQGQPRRLVDGAAAELLRPFSFAGHGSAWARRGFPTLLALLVYGLGLGFLARAATGVRRRPRDPQSYTSIGSPSRIQR